MRLRSTATNVGLLLVSTALSLLFLEGAIRLLHIDTALMVKSLYYQSADLPVHESIADPLLHYRLRPDSSMSGSSGDRRYSVSIGHWGNRNPGFGERKKRGVMRILCAGGSTMYGANVDDDQTIPAQLQKILATRKQKVEVWNFGTSAYTLAQASVLAGRQAKLLQADLVIIHLSSLGRRAFLQPASGESFDLRMWLEKDPLLLSENFPAELSSWPGMTEDTHHSLLQLLALYRSVSALMRLRQPQQASSFGDELSRQMARQVWQWGQQCGIPVIFVAIPASGGRIRPEDVFPGLPDGYLIDLFQPDREEPFYRAHPPAPCLAEYARTIAAELASRGLVAQ